MEFFGRSAASLIAICGLASYLAQAEPVRARAVQPQLDQAVRQLAEVTGLEFRRRVQFSIITRQELERLLEKRIHKEIRPQEVRIEERVLKKFGLVPEDFDLLKTLTALYAEQAAALYDFQEKKLYLLDSNSETLEQMAVVHELAHALADQHFNLRRFLRSRVANDDSALARMAVMEGQATWLMSELAIRESGQSLLAAPELVGMMARMINVSARGFPVFDGAPLYIQQSLLFPYSAGMKFQQAVLQKWGREGFRRVFEHPPQTTQQVLHPEKYFNGVVEEAVQLPRVEPRGVFRKLAEGAVGEFDYAVLLQQYLGEEAVRAIAPSWRGGVYRFLEHRHQPYSVLIQATVWENEGVADEFRNAYLRILEKKWGGLEVTGQSLDETQGKGPDGWFCVKRLGKKVYLVEGMPPGTNIRWPELP